mmetsp:Transcript_4224/g.9675  ORF Transcript_4224/g.9675 Transcript_4224/m.9675 type:complete len:226 (+) Transcript_4224:921-1598(+)
MASLERSGSIMLKVAVALSSRRRTGGTPFIMRARKRESSGSSGPCRQQLMGWEYVIQSWELEMSAVETHSCLSGMMHEPNTPRPLPCSVRLTPVMASNWRSISEARPEPSLDPAEVSAGAQDWRICSSCLCASSWRLRCCSSFLRFISASCSAWSLFWNSSLPRALVSTQGPSSSTSSESRAKTRTWSASSAGRLRTSDCSSAPTASGVSTWLQFSTCWLSCRRH